MLKTFNIDAIVPCDESSAIKTRDFINQHAKNIKRLYSADYSNTPVRPMLRMLGFDGKMIPGAASPGKLKIKTLFCYEDDFELLEQLINSIKE